MKYDDRASEKRKAVTLTRGDALREGQYVWCQGRRFVVLPPIPGDPIMFLGGAEPFREGSLLPLIPDHEYELEV